MKWKIDPDPKINDTRTITKFAWFPVTACNIREQWDNKEHEQWHNKEQLCKVWLETYKQEQRYVHKSSVHGWYEGWIEVNNYI